MRREKFEGKRILFPAPITRFSDIAAMALKCFTGQRQSGPMPPEVGSN